jgi:hypothetical protein
MILNVFGSISLNGDVSLNSQKQGDIISKYILIQQNKGDELELKNL